MTEQPHKPCPYDDCGSSDSWVSNEDFPSLLYNQKSGLFYRVDFKRLTGTVAPHGYVVLTYNYTSYLGHRLAFYFMENRWPTQIDHIDRDRSNNSYGNIREVTATQQATNKEGWSSCGKKGVYFRKDRQKWHVRVRLNGKTHHVGYFDCLEEASEAYKKAAKTLHKDYYCGEHNSQTLSL